jgi:hypothetical protein
MKKILVSFGLILTLVLCCALVPVNAAEECAHEKVTFQYFLEGQSKPTTCAESGIAKYTCDACKVAVYKKEVGKHVVDYVVEDATCTKAQKVTEKCTVCKTVLAETVVAEALGHDFVETLIEASCESAAGVAAKCSRCDEKKDFAPFEEGHELYAPAKGHKWDEGKVVAPTCKEGGYTLQTCANCKATQKVNKTEADKVNGHKSVRVAVLKEATCKTNGIGKFACELCKEELGYASIAASHKWDEENMIIVEAATCAKDGKATLKCIACDAKKENVVIAATGEHTWEDVVLGETCTEGSKVGKQCSVCKKAELVAVEGSVALGHDWEEKLIEASCEKGNGVKRECKRCDAAETEYFAETDPLYEAPKGHKAVEVKVVAATCSKTGLTAGSKCSVCGTVLVKQEEVAKDANSHTAELVKTLKEATCTTTGVGKYACKDCKADLGYKAIAAGHKLGELVVDVAATCAKAGKGHKECANCDYVEKDIVIAATGEHDFVEKAIDATCTEADKVGKECSVCKAQKDVTVVEGSKPNGHDWKETPVDASCTTAAGVNKVCKVCEAKEFVAYTGELAEAAKGHNYETKVVEGTCKVAGYTAEICKNCKDVRNKVEGTTNPEKHNPTQGAILKEATCTTTGVAKQVCKDCGEGLGYVAVPAGHSFGEETIANEAGTLVYVKCEDCDAIKVVAYFGKKEVAVGTVFASLAKFDEAEKPAEAK